MVIACNKSRMVHLAGVKGLQLVLILINHTRAVPDRRMKKMVLFLCFYVSPHTLPSIMCSYSEVSEWDFIYWPQQCDLCVMSFPVNPLLMLTSRKDQNMLREIERETEIKIERGKKRY